MEQPSFRFTQDDLDADATFGSVTAGDRLTPTKTRAAVELQVDPTCYSDWFEVSQVTREVDNVELKLRSLVGHVFTSATGLSDALLLDQGWFRLKPDATPRH